MDTTQIPVSYQLEINWLYRMKKSLLEAETALQQQGRREIEDMIAERIKSLELMLRAGIVLVAEVQTESDENES